MMVTIAEELDHLADVRAAREQILQQYEQLYKEAMPEDVSKRLDELQNARDEAVKLLDFQASNITDSITRGILELKASVNGRTLQAVYSKPRITWDADKLEGFSAAHPEILVFRREGKPSVSIRIVKE